MAGANTEPIKQLLAREFQHSGAVSGRGEDSPNNNHPMMSVPNPVAVGHRGSQPYQSVMKPMAKEKNEKAGRGGDPDMGDMSNQNVGMNGHMQQMAAMLQMSQ